MSLVREYFELTKKYDEIYGEKSIVLMQVGSFFEIYAEATDDPKMRVASEILNLRIAKKKLAIQTVAMAGFPDHAVKRFEKILLLNGFTIVYVTQKQNGKKFERTTETIVSPGSNIDDIEDVESKMGSFLIEFIDDDTFVSFSTFDVTTGEFVIHRNVNVPKQHLKRHIRELCVDNSLNEALLNFSTTNDDFVNQFDIVFDKFVLIHKRVYNDSIASNDTTYQDLRLNEFFKSFSNLYRDIRETLELQDALVCDIANLLLMCEFVQIHDALLIANLPKPRVMCDDTTDVLKFNEVDLKLNIFSIDSKNLFTLLNKTITNQGSKKLRALLHKPTYDAEILNQRYDSVQKFIDSNSSIQHHLKNYACNVPKLYRRITINKFQVDDVQKVFKINATSREIIAILNILDANFVPSKDEYESFKAYDESLRAFFSDDFINDELTETTIFNHRCIFRSNDEIRELFEKLNEIQTKLLNLKAELDNIVEVKLNVNDKMGFYFETSKKRAVELKSFDYDFATTASSSKLTSNTTRTLTEKYHVLISELKSKEHSIVAEFFADAYKTYRAAIMTINECVVWADVFYSFAKTAIESNFVRPRIEPSSSSSFLDAKQLRHPLIENAIKNTRKRFIANDVSLNENGLVLFGVNSAGKSSLMKSIGVSVLMAQAGMYVAASEFIFSPFKRIAVRVGNSDNLFDAHSSFVSEVIEIENIVQKSNNHSLILADEVCSSTERESASAIIVALVKWLSLKRSCFVVSSHIFDIIPKLEMCTSVRFCYLDIDINENIVFLRNLKYGVPTIQNYGTRIAKSIFNDENFVKILDRESAMPSSNTSLKKSRYNSKHFVFACQICDSTETLDVHHIDFQCDALDGFNRDGSKLNDASNLVTLCKSCHNDVHRDRVQIRGFRQNLNGCFLHVEKTQK